jgi:hypothetical protein
MANNILHSSETDQWYTPKKFTDAAKRVFGGKIDLDPASCQLANDICVQAENFFTVENDGLSQDWYGSVFCNPPYGRGANNRSNQDIWSEKIVDEYKKGNIEQGILLVNAATAQKWFQKLWEFPICFVTPRIKFVDRFGDESKSPGHPSVFVYIGKKNYAQFLSEFSEFGHVSYSNTGPIARSTPNGKSNLFFEG